MLKNMKIIGLSVMLLTITPYTHPRTCNWSTLCKTAWAGAIGIPFGLLRLGSHMLTRSTARKIWGETDSFILRKPLAIVTATAMWLTLNSILEVSRTSLAEKIEQNLDDERENIYLTHTIARYADWMIGVFGIAAFECYGDTKKAMTALQYLFTPKDDTLPVTLTDKD